MPIADLQIPNSTAGFASLIGWLQTHRPGPEVVVGVEGTRGYGIGLTRALHAAGYKVVQVDPSLHRRRGKGAALDRQARAEQPPGIGTEPGEQP